MKKMTHIIVAMFLVLSIGGFITPPPAKAAGGKAVVKVNTLNVREGPGLTYEIITQIHKGKSYPITDEKGDWFKLKLSDQKTGWVASWLVSYEKDTPEKFGSVSSTVDGLRVRKGPGTNFAIMGHMYKNETYSVVKVSESWIQLKYKGALGWASRSYLQEAAAPNSDENNDSETNREAEATITASTLNVRSGPSTSFNIVGTLKKGDTIVIVDVKNGWYQILFAGKTAWVAGQYAKKTAADSPAEPSTPEEDDQAQAPQKPQEPNEPNEPQQPTTLQKAIVAASILNVRSTHSTTGEIIAKLRKETEVTILEEKNNWNKIQFEDSKTGWVAGWYLTFIQPENPNDEETPSDPQVDVSPYVTILYNGTNIRKAPTTATAVVGRANQGDQFPIVSKEGDWYQIQLPDGTTAYIAGWIVSASGAIPQVERDGINDYLKNKVIVIDPGHGGRDTGTSGVSGTIEKDLTLRTAQLLEQKLTAAGAKVVLTRNSDYYISLSYRVSVSHYHQADAFISLHYDSSTYASANGISSFYYTKDKDAALTSSVHNELIKSTGLRNRGVKFGNFQVLRSNRQPAVLAELGFLSHPKEELTVVTSSFQDKATEALTNGLARFFAK